VHGTPPASVIRVGSKENQTGVRQAEKGTSAVGQNFLLFFLSVSLRFRQKEIL
jgi:hypothetical protein